MIQVIRGERVILDTDLAKVYGVPTFRFNEAIKRNRSRFPADFLFQLTREEQEALTSQNTMSKPTRGGRRTLPYAFTEHGALMAANILKSQRAVAMSVFVVRAFVKMRDLLTNNKLLAEKLSALEHQLTDRLDDHERAILQILEEIKDLAQLPNETDGKPREIGFHVKDSTGKALKKVKGVRL
ncbi:conserved hypothetical protein [Pedosphaera parvula Ellin514]|uniref:KilA-N DNA-binding domain-containing protein n=2 Tax=Pedosphaera TaxID=1032526 RepID=B9XMB3_PEDPL|nr:conserved hypothetical protein [Pedosphaera parvula Ellin514]